MGIEMFMETVQNFTDELAPGTGLRIADGVFYAEVRLPGQAAGFRVALHGVRTLVQAAEALLALGQTRWEPSPLLPALAA